METERKETMTYESRMQVASELTSKMSTMFQPHVRLRDERAGAMYLSEITEAINSRLPSELPNHEVYRSACREIWQGIVAKHKSSYWFSLSDVISATNKVASKYYGIYRDKDKIQKAFSGSFDAEQQARQEERKPETIEGWLEKLKETDRMITSGELRGGLGSILRRIPVGALKRLGYEGDTGLPSIGQTPPEHLPEPPKTEKPIMSMDKSELDMRLIKAGHTAPKFEDSGEFVDDEVPDFSSL
jgi:hypothetical protein